MTVAIAGAASPVGEHIVRAFAPHGAVGGHPVFGKVVALDAERGAADAHWRLVDLISPALARALRGVDALVHVAASTDLAADLTVSPRTRRERAVLQVQTLVTAAAAAGAAHLVVVSSAMSYGAPPSNPVPLEEDAPLSAQPDEGLVGDLLAVEHVLETARTVHPGLTVTVVRPAALVGPGIDTVLTRQFEAPRLLTVKSGRPAWQFC